MPVQPRTEFGDLSACDREPIQTISAIQDRGFFLTFTLTDLRVRNVSENAGKFLNLTSGFLPGRNLREVLGVEAASELHEQIHGQNFRERRQSFFPLELASGDYYEAFLYRLDDLFALELEPLVKTTAENENSTHERLNDAVTAMREAGDVAQAGRALCVAFRRLTGMDRVMIYKFLPPTWHGEVIAQDKVAEAHSFLHHRFPASDIPRPARDLYLRNRLRFIGDSSAAPSAISPNVNPLTRKVLDLSDSRLRAVSPIHIEYLRNMNVACSFSVAIIVDQRLWGLVACHHEQAMNLNTDSRLMCEMLANVYAMRIRLEENGAEIARQIAVDQGLRELVRELSRSEHPELDLLKFHTKIESTLQASGMALVRGESVDMAGLTPTRADVLTLAGQCLERMSAHPRGVLALTNLSLLDERWATYCRDGSGVLALAIPGSPGSVWMIFRPEVVQTVQWGGDPYKSLNKREYEGRINPRESFASWTETIRGESKPWTEDEVTSTADFRDLVFEGLAEKQHRIRELSERMQRP